MNLLNLERMNGTERLAEALRMRGLFVEMEKDFIVLTNENTTADIEGVQLLLGEMYLASKKCRKWHLKMYATCHL